MLLVVCAKLLLYSALSKHSILDFFSFTRSTDTKRMYISIFKLIDLAQLAYLNVDYILQNQVLSQLINEVLCIMKTKIFLFSNVPL